MQTHRLFEIIYLLLDQKQMTAAELAQHFEVSVRTIYRDIDRLSLAGIPIYTNVGKNGGIALMDGYTLDKSLLTNKEQGEIMMALQSLKAAEYPDADGVLSKLGSFLNTNRQNWIEVDFTDWGGSSQDLARFDRLKNAILERRTIHFTYHNSAGKESNRRADPVQLLFKGRNWYLQAFCHQRKAMRIFKMFRIQNLQITDAFFDPYPVAPFHEKATEMMTNLHFKIDKSRAYRVYDEFPPKSITLLPDGSFEIKTALPADNWLIGYLLSFGSSLYVIEPPWLNLAVKEEARKILEVADLE